MATWDPEAAQAAAIYLRLDEKTMLEMRSATFEGKTAVWVPSKEEGYQKATLLDKKASKDGMKVVQLADGSEKEFKEASVDQQNPPKYELCEDMANMTYLSEATVVHNLKSRYELFLIYTYSGKSCTVPLSI